jgi:hypothetical protein
MDAWELDEVQVKTGVWVAVIPELLPQLYTDLHGPYFCA